MHATKSSFPALFLAIVIGCTALIVLQFFTQCPKGNCVFGEDFQPFYKAAQAIAHGDIAGVYDTARTQAWLDGKEQILHPFLYPPHSLLFLYPFGNLSYTAALTLWSVLQMVFLWLALQTPYMRSVRANLSGGFAGQNGLLLVLFLPFLAANLLAGQAGTLWATLFILVLAWRGSHPVLAGLALACFSLKPQLGLLLPLLLLAERNWRAVLWAILFTAIMGALSVAVWGLQLWQNFIAMTSLFSEVVGRAPTDLISVSASPYMALRMFDIPASLALLLQAVLSLCVLAWIWPIFARRPSEFDLLLALPAAAFLFVPYTCIYDTVPLGLCALPLFIRMQSGAAASFERIALVLLAFIPIIAIKLQPMHIPYCMLCIALVFGISIALARRNTISETFGSHG